jgi:peptide deformylase
MNINTNETQLRKKCEPIKLQEVSSIIKSIPEMVRLVDKQQGVGLAANQVGIYKRFFIVRLNGKTTVFINPEIVEYSKDTTTTKEGCLSFPGVFTDIERSKWITVKYFNYKQMRVVKETYHAFVARIIQHEYDHLNGVICVLDKGKKEAI